MYKLITCSFLMIILIFGLVGCSNNKNKNEERTDVAEVGDFKVKIYANQGENLDVKATLTYMGDKEKVTVYHGENVFKFSAKEIDGDFGLGSFSLQQSESKTTLIRYKPHEVAFYSFPHQDLNEIPSGTYEFEATAEFALEKDGEEIEIPVSTIVEVKKDK